MTTPKNQNKRGVHLPSEDWSEFASGIGPDTRQPDNHGWRQWPAPEDGEFTVVYRPDAGMFGARYRQARCSCCSWPETCGEWLWFSEDGEDLSGDLPTMWMRPKPPEKL